MRTIVLLTDFGTRDPFVGIMKCVIAQIAPEANVIDLVHEIPPQDVLAGAFALVSARRFLPEGAIVVGVVDPGVGTSRRAIAAETRGAIFVGPDNGLFSLVFREERPKRVVSIEDERHFLHPVSSTFHGRDVFAPVAAHVARGTKLSTLGPRVTSWVELDVPEPTKTKRGVRGVVVAVDRYGNAITNVPGEWVRATDVVEVGRRRLRVAKTYGDAPEGEPLALVSSGGTLEIAINGGDASARLGIARGTKVEIIRAW